MLKCIYINNKMHCSLYGFIYGWKNSPQWWRAIQCERTFAFVFFLLALIPPAFLKPAIFCSAKIRCCSSSEMLYNSKNFESKKAGTVREPQIVDMLAVRAASMS